MFRTSIAVTGFTKADIVNNLQGIIQLIKDGELHYKEPEESKQVVRFDLFEPNIPTILPENKVA